MKLSASGTAELQGVLWKNKERMEQFIQLYSELFSVMREEFIKEGFCEQQFSAGKKCPTNQRFVSIAVKYSLLMAPDRNIVMKKIIPNAVWPGNEKTDRIVMPEKGKQSRTADVLPEMNHRQ